MRQLACRLAYLPMIRSVCMLYKHALAMFCKLCAAARAQSRNWKLQYAMATVGVVLSEKVDTTLSKGVLRILGTISGGVIGAPPAPKKMTCSVGAAEELLACATRLILCPSFMLPHKPGVCQVQWTTSRESLSACGSTPPMSCSAAEMLSVFPGPRLRHDGEPAAGQKRAGPGMYHAPDLALMTLDKWSQGLVRWSQDLV